jgi:hypothetical protein
MTHSFNSNRLILSVVLLLVAVALLNPLAVMAQDEPEPTPTSQLFNPAFLVDDGLLSSEACAPPCWNDITPGETIWTEALALIEGNPAFANVQQMENADAGLLSVSWQPVAGESCCEIIAIDGEIVDQIFLRAAPGHTVGDLLAAHGDPAYAVGNSYVQDEAIVTLIYPDVPMIVYAFVPGRHVELTEASEIIGVLYTTPAFVETFLQTSNLHAWEGLGSYSRYENVEGAAFEITPVAAE